MKMQYNEANYKSAGNSISPAINLLDRLSSRIRDVKNQLKALDSYNASILRSNSREDQEAMNEVIVPKLYELRELHLARLNESIAEFEVAKESFVEILNLLIGEWTPPPSPKPEHKTE